MKTRRAARSIRDLAEDGLLSATTPELERVAAQFGVAVTSALEDLIDPTDPRDPIAAQFVPSRAELTTHPDELADPIGDARFTPVAGIVHRYPDRALLKVTHTCAAYCRFCFRREQVGGEKPLDGPELEAALAYIRAHDEIWEVILSGGDPLVLSDRRLGEVVARLNAIPHVKIIRIHTRLPVANPARVTPELVAALRGRAPVYVLLHCNHPRELSAAARAACARLADAGFPLLSQSVLLRGVNDDPATLAALMRAFVECRVKPHYLHHLDLARGTGHFRVPLAEAQKLLKTLRGHLSGLCQPTFMLDLPGGHGKAPVGPVFAEPAEDGSWVIEDYQGTRHRYAEPSGSRPKTGHESA